MDNLEFIEILKTSGGLMSGHTSFKNGLHGNGWIEKGFIIRKPKVLDRVTHLQAEMVRDSFPEVDLLIGPIVNGSIVASFVAKHLEKEFAITVGKGPEIEFHRMHIPEKGRRVVLIEDLVFTGTDVKDNIKFLTEYGLFVQGVAVWINRQSSNLGGVQVVSLTDSPFEFYPQTECPLCKNGDPVLYSGVRE